MVKGISRQVILVRGGQDKLFDQAIFILREDNPEVSEDALIQEAKAMLRRPERPRLWRYSLFWAGLGALAVGLAWAIVWLA